MSDLLVDTQWLQDNLGKPGVVLVDCRFSLADTKAGRRAYDEAHIPGAVYADLETDLSGPVTAHSGRHPLPNQDDLAGRFSAWGIDETTQVVAYDDAGGAMAARLWWLARWLGHRYTALLDGGLGAWLEAGGALEASTPAAGARLFQPRVDDGLWVSAAEVEAGLEQDRVTLVDARAAERFSGEMEPIDPVAGHVPGAINRPFTENLDAAGRFRPAAVLRDEFASMLAERSPWQVVHMCGSGVTACHNLLAMEVAGLPGARLYAGSWSEWVRDPARAMARGEA